MVINTYTCKHHWIVVRGKVLTRDDTTCCQRRCRLYHAWYLSTPCQGRPRMPRPDCPKLFSCMEHTLPHILTLGSTWTFLTELMCVICVYAYTYIYKYNICFHKYVVCTVYMCNCYETGWKLDTSLLVRQTDKPTRYRGRTSREPRGRDCKVTS